VSITTPSEHLICDLFVHRDLEFALHPDVLIFGRIFQQGQETGGLEDSSRLPIHASVTELSGRPPAVATPLVPRYSELVRWVHQRVGWEQTEFRGVRLELKYPPLGSQVVLRFGLPDRA